MLIEIINEGENLMVYTAYNTQQKLFNFKPFCLINEDDFLDLLTDREIEKAQNGKIHFNIALSELENRAKIVYPRY